MKKVDNKQKAIILLTLWGPVVLQMCIIFYFSSQPAGSVVVEEFPFSTSLGHLGGYFILGLLLYRAFNSGHFAWSRKSALISLVAGIIYAMSDEFHQLFVAGRQASLSDVVLDTIGLLLFIIMLRIKSMTGK